MAALAARQGTKVAIAPLIFSMENFVIFNNLTTWHLYLCGTFIFSATYDMMVYYVDCIHFVNFVKFC